MSAVLSDRQLHPSAALPLRCHCCALLSDWVFYAQGVTMSRKVIHFEIHASSASAHRLPTPLTLWLKFQQWERSEYWQVETGPSDQTGINGEHKSRGGSAAPLDSPGCQRIHLHGQVSSLDESFSKALSLGAHRSVAKCQFLIVGWLAYVKDPDANILGLMQPDPGA